MRGHDWSTSALGAPEAWPQSLRTAVSLMLNSRFPMFMAWGPQLAFLYNDAYAPIFGAKHPHTLGLPFAQVWSEIWDDVRPLVDQALSGEASFHENLHLVMERNGFPEDTWYTFSYSPVRDETGGVAGMFCACQETTGQVLGERRLAEQAARQLRLFEQAPGFIIIMRGPDHTVEFVNDVHRRVFGSDDWTGKTIRDAFPSIAGQGFYELLDGVYRTGVAHEAEGAMVNYRRTPDGPEETRYLTFIYAPLTGDNGEITGVFCEGFDVTGSHTAQVVEQRQARHLQLLIDELNHRVKNTLAIVQSLAQQTFRGDAATPEARLAFDGRLVALASAHNLLTREHWEFADLHDLVVQSLRALGVETTRFTIDGPRLRLAPKTAVTIAMALHELATNASKYGALSGDGGRVSVTWTADGDTERRLRLTWAEAGGPPVVPPARQGFGSRMIERALASELGGSVVLDFDTDGVACRIEATLPPPDALAAEPLSLGR